MDDQTRMSILRNDLDSIAHRIECLPAHPALTQAGESVRMARDWIAQAQGDLHQEDIKRRYDI